MKCGKCSIRTVTVPTWLLWYRPGWITVSGMYGMCVPVLVTRCKCCGSGRFEITTPWIRIRNSKILGTIRDPKQFQKKCQYFIISCLLPTVFDSLFFSMATKMSMQDPDPAGSIFNMPPRFGSEWNAYGRIHNTGWLPVRVLQGNPRQCLLLGVQKPRPALEKSTSGWGCCRGVALEPNSAPGKFQLKNKKYPRTHYWLIWVGKVKVCLFF